MSADRCPDEFRGRCRCCGLPAGHDGDDHFTSLGRAEPEALVPSAEAPAPLAASTACTPPKVAPGPGQGPRDSDPAKYATAIALGYLLATIDREHLEALAERAERAESAGSVYASVAARKIRRWIVRGMYRYAP